MAIPATISATISLYNFAPSYPDLSEDTVLAVLAAYADYALNALAAAHRGVEVTVGWTREIFDGPRVSVTWDEEALDEYGCPPSEEEALVERVREDLDRAHERWLQSDELRALLDGETEE